MPKRDIGDKKDPPGRNGLEGHRDTIPFFHSGTSSSGEIYCELGDEGAQLRLRWNSHGMEVSRPSHGKVVFRIQLQLNSYRTHFIIHGILMQSFSASSKMNAIHSSSAAYPTVFSQQDSTASIHETIFESCKSSNKAKRALIPMFQIGCVLLISPWIR
ncbi:hypothetical protein CDAR_486321 [Caerostris darwini]|uniref:Uncharacterized protein n=1 Tax=Caerostris darwini TaxID=1538125 RepID=A0AAV4MAX3_9ARAC|nr:hypothetical protein CDAR_486321 [Caerostris darwini]